MLLYRSAVAVKASAYPLVTFLYVLGLRGVLVDRLAQWQNQVRCPPVILSSSKAGTKQAADLFTLLEKNLNKKISICTTVHNESQT